MAQQQPQTLAQQPTCAADLLALVARVAEEERLSQVSKEPGISPGLEAALAALAAPLLGAEQSRTPIALEPAAWAELGQLLCVSLPSRVATAEALARHPSAVLSYARALSFCTRQQRGSGTRAVWTACGPGRWC